MPDIHPTALVSPKAELAGDVLVGAFSIVEDDVVIEEGSRIDTHCLIANGSRIGKNCRIHHGTAVSTIPQDLKFKGEKTTFEIGDNTVIREFCALNRGTEYHEKSKIGRNSFLMAYTHVGHDCFVGDHVIMANVVQLGGHVTIEDWVSIGGGTPVHQFCTIGRHSFVGGGYRVVQDIPPYILVAGEPLEYKGLNIVGLTRRGFRKETIALLRKCYRIIYRSRLSRSHALERIENEIEQVEEVRAVVEFVRNSKRGIVG